MTAGNRRSGGGIEPIMTPHDHATEIVTGKARNQIIEFGGLAVLDAMPSRSSWDLRESAAAALERLGAAVPPGLLPDEEHDAERLEAACADPGSVAWWLPLLSCTDEDFRYTDDHLAWLARRTRIEAITALVLGGGVDHLQAEDDAEEPVAAPATFPGPAGGPCSDEEVLPEAVQALVRRAADLPNLRALFVGEIDDGQRHLGVEIDVASLLDALPQLTDLAMCAEFGPRFRPCDHAGLRRLACYGTMPPDEVRGLAACGLPSLEHLEVWSTEDFGDSQDPEERSALGDLIQGATMPRLRHLGMRDFTFIDEQVGQLAESPLLPRLHTLDLSLSLLGDEGAQVLLDTPAFRDLTRLDLRRHAMTVGMAERVSETFTAAGVDIDTGHGRRKA